ncbi:Peroxisomal targeting signal 1 receptor [Halotydeus destructor]|nr:Peroxisomal targeting signal 1 receptor [Halotydeus destructor]
MAMRNLVEAECGGANPLMKVANHFVRKDLPEQIISLRSHVGPAGQPMVIDPRQVASEALERQNIFKMDALIMDMERIESEKALMNQPMQHLDPRVFRPRPDGKWADEFIGAPPPWASQYLRDQQVIVSKPHQQELHQNQSIAQSRQAQFAFRSSLHQQLNQHPLLYQNQVSSANTASAAGLTAAEFLDLVSSVKTAEVNTNPTANTWAQEYATRQENASDKQEGSEVKEEKDDLEFWEQLARDWDQMTKDDGPAHEWLDDLEAVSEPYAENYKFEEENPLKDVDNPFEEGLKKLELGDIPSAVLLFEAACQKDPQNGAAWQYLGTTQAKNEHDDAAIRALKQTVQLDPSNLTAWMGLAVSYTNESLQRQAADALGEWLTRNPRYSELVAGSFVEHNADATPKVVSSFMSAGHFNQVREAYILAARQQPSGLDPDVQCGLGVLFNLSGEYDKATDCFRAALDARPSDPLLWNRLGATLANGNKSEDAVAAYSKALEISPGFIRSRFNLGISCINLGAHQEAAEHFLNVLNLQNAGRGPKGEQSRRAMSNNVWSSLRMVLSLMGRQDLYGAVETRDLARLNGEFKMAEFTQ